MRTNYGSSGAQALPPSQAPSAGADDVTSAGKESILACALGIKGSGGSRSKRHPLRTRRPPAEWWPVAGDPRLWEGAGPWEPLVLIWDLSQPGWGLCWCLWDMVQLRGPVLAGGCPPEAPVRWLGERSSQTRPCLWVRQPRYTLRSGERIRALGAAGVTKAGVGGGVKAHRGCAWRDWAHRPRSLAGRRGRTRRNRKAGGAGRRCAVAASWPPFGPGAMQDRSVLGRPSSTSGVFWSPHPPAPRPTHGPPAPAGPLPGQTGERTPRPARSLRAGGLSRATAGSATREGPRPGGARAGEEGSVVAQGLLGGRDPQGAACERVAGKEP